MHTRNKKNLQELIVLTIHVKTVLNMLLWLISSNHLWRSLILYFALNSFIFHRFYRMRVTSYIRVESTRVVTHSKYFLAKDRTLFTSTMRALTQRRKGKYFWPHKDALLWWVTYRLILTYHRMTSFYSRE